MEVLGYFAAIIAVLLAIGVVYAWGGKCQKCSSWKNWKDEEVTYNDYHPYLYLKNQFAACSKCGHTNSLGQTVHRRESSPYKPLV